MRKDKLRFVLVVLEIKISGRIELVQKSFHLRIRPKVGAASSGGQIKEHSAKTNVGIVKEAAVFLKVSRKRVSDRTGLGNQSANPQERQTHLSRQHGERVEV
jgi:hypothetical protein